MSQHVTCSSCSCCRSTWRCEALYVAHAEQPKNARVIATIENGLPDCRVFNKRMPNDVAACEAQCQCVCMCYIDGYMSRQSRLTTDHILNVRILNNMHHTVSFLPCASYLRDLHNCFHGGLAPTWLESILGSKDVEEAVLPVSQ